MLRLQSLQICFPQSTILRISVDKINLMQIFGCYLLSFKDHQKIAYNEMYIIYFTNCHSCCVFKTKKNAYETQKFDLGKMTGKVLVQLFDSIFSCKFAQKKLMSGRLNQTVMPYLVSFYPFAVIVVLNQILYVSIHWR